MAALDSTPFPLVELHCVANAQNEWVALTLRLSSRGDGVGALHALFGTPDLLAAIAPLDCLLLLDTTAMLSPPVLALLPPNRVGFVIAAASLAEEGAAARLSLAHEHGYRILLEGAVPAGAEVPPALRSVARDCSEAAPPPGTLAVLFGPHLARNVGSAARFSECENAGFDWFSGAYQLDSPAQSGSQDGTSRRRLLALLALLARDADSRDLEQQLKQDAALSYHLLKLVNSAAFAVSTQITSFAQAINLLGRRQMQRWLQLLLYARQQPDGLPNLLLPLAALRGAQLEALCKREGGDRDDQDLAFMTGVFSLLDRLLGMPMHEIVADLNLPSLVVQALLERAGPLGERLRLAESPPSAHELEVAGIEPALWWSCQLDAYHWAIQVGRNV